MSDDIVQLLDGDDVFRATLSGLFFGTTDRRDAVSRRSANPSIGPTTCCQTLLTSCVCTWNVRFVCSCRRVCSGRRPHRAPTCGMEARATVNLPQSHPYDPSHKVCLNIKPRIDGLLVMSTSCCAPVQDCAVTSTMSTSRWWIGARPQRALLRRRVM